MSGFYGAGEGEELASRRLLRERFPVERREYPVEEDGEAGEEGIVEGQVVAIRPATGPGSRGPYNTEHHLAATESDAVLQVRRRLSTAEWRKKFLAIFEATGNRTAAIRAAGISSATLQEHLASSPQFKAQYDEALDIAIGGLELEAWKRAKSGSDFLLWRLMQSLRPDVYGDRRTVEHKFTQSERREAYALAKKEGLSDEEARDAVAAAEDMLRQSRGRGS